MLSNDDHKAVAALLRGQGCANHLKSLIEKGSVPTESLVDTILDSFSLALSLMISSVPPPPPQHESSSSQDLAPKRSLKLKKKNCGREGLKQYRDDCLSPLINDGFSWRKYGNKKIKTSPYQRSYYRCSYANEQNCNATKRVQQIQDNPSVHRTTYVGKHICEEVKAFSQQPSDDVSNGSKMIRFDKLDQVMSESAMPQLVSIDHQETVEDQGIDQIMNQECHNNKLVIDDDQFWTTYPFSPDNCMFLDDISVFDYITSQV